MSEAAPAVGTLMWHDLTVANAEAVRDFYAAVIGWEAKPEDMGGHNDYHMLAPGTGEPVTGICHARGANADLPPVWLLYFRVADVAASAARCVDLGGKILSGPRELCGELMCVIEDPAGAICAICGPLQVGA